MQLEYPGEKIQNHEVQNPFDAWVIRPASAAANEPNIIYFRAIKGLGYVGFRR